MAEAIRSLVREEGYRYRDIAVIAADVNVYADALEKACGTFDIPVFMDHKKSILLNAFVEYLRSLLRWQSRILQPTVSSGVCEQGCAGLRWMRRTGWRITVWRSASKATENGSRRGSGELRVWARKNSGSSII